MPERRVRRRRRAFVALAFAVALAPLACGQPNTLDADAPGATGTAQPPAAADTLEEAASIDTLLHDAASIEKLLQEAASISPLRAVVVAHDGEVIAERGYRGASVDSPANIKSASKTVMSALVGIAIDKGLLEGTDQPVAPLLRDQLPPDPDPRLARITIGHLLAMQAGLEPTSGRNYGRWVSSANWVRDALARPFVDEPGGAMLYSTGSSHLLSAILVRAAESHPRAGAECRAEARFVLTGWDRDPHDPFGGNNMAMGRAAARLRRAVPHGGWPRMAAGCCRRRGSRLRGRRARARATPVTAMAMAGSCATSPANRCAMPGALAARCSTSFPGWG